MNVPPSWTGPNGHVLHEPWFPARIWDNFAELITEQQVAGPGLAGGDLLAVGLLLAGVADGDPGGALGHHRQPYRRGDWAALRQAASELDVLYREHGHVRRR